MMSEKVTNGVCPLCDHRLERHDKYGACDVITPLPHLGDRLDICNCGHGERMAAKLQDWKDAQNAPKPPLRERVEKLLKRHDPRITSEIRKLLKDAVAESSSWFAQYEAWMKRGMEAEHALNTAADNEEKLARIERELRYIKESPNKQTVVPYLIEELHNREFPQKERGETQPATKGGDA